MMTIKHNLKSVIFTAALCMAGCQTTMQDSTHENQCPVTVYDTYMAPIQPLTITHWHIDGELWVKGN